VTRNEVMNQNFLLMNQFLTKRRLAKINVVDGAQLGFGSMFNIQLIIVIVDHERQSEFADFQDPAGRVSNLDVPQQRTPRTGFETHQEGITSNAVVIRGGSFIPHAESVVYKADAPDIARLTGQFPSPFPGHAKDIIQVDSRIFPIIGVKLPDG
jgi:hypothetical protein